MASWQQACIVLVVLVLALLPKETPGPLDDEVDDQLLGTQISIAMNCDCNIVECRFQLLVL